MTKFLLATLVAAMLALTGLVAFNTLSAPDPVAPDAAAIVTEGPADGACPFCTHEAGCPAVEAKTACCDEGEKPGCCKGDAAVKPGAAAAKGDTKKD